MQDNASNTDRYPSAYLKFVFIPQSQLSQNAEEESHAIVYLSRECYLRLESIAQQVHQVLD